MWTLPKACVLLFYSQHMVCKWRCYFIVCPLDAMPVLLLQTENTLKRFCLIMYRVHLITSHFQAKLKPSYFLKDRMKLQKVLLYLNIILIYIFLEIQVTIVETKLKLLLLIKQLLSVHAVALQSLHSYLVKKSHLLFFEKS